MSAPLLSVERLSKTFVRTGALSWLGRGHEVKHAVSDVTFTLEPGEVLGIVGESGSGKTTLSRMVLRLIEPTNGRVLLHGRNVLSFSREELLAVLRPAVRMIFQEPDAVLNPGYAIGVGLARAVRMRGEHTDADVSRIVGTLLQQVGLDPSYASKYPDELSGGEKRRIGICRALATDPEIIVADEPLSGLDVVLQERVLELLRNEQERRGFALILVSHDLDRVNQVCDRVLVMHAGRVVEQTTLRRDGGPIRDQYRHPYSMLLQNARVDNADVDVNAGLDEPTPDGSASIPTGCSFAPFCGRRKRLGDPEICRKEVPVLVAVSDDQSIACHFSGEDDLISAAVGGRVQVELIS